MKSFLTIGLRALSLSLIQIHYLSLIRKGDQENFQLVSQRLQTVRLELFSDLGPGDILFIDSTHVAKFSSDVNYLFFEILPSIRAGVYIHFHDIFFPFEYPDEWLIEGRAWNEAYIMRAFLQYNDIFRIVLFPTFLARFHRDSYFAAMPLCAKNIGGCIWLKKEK